MSFKNKILLITGGTGSFGNAVLRRFINEDLKEIRIFSRDEKKQDDLRKKYISQKNIKYFIGDVRDRQSVDSAMRDVDYVFHAAALKQVPSCEFHPIEAVKTNIMGTDNVLNSAIDNNVSKVICLSTDKAVQPINAMGMSKALMEKTFVAKSRTISNSKTIICGTRYGNVMASRGSVIPLFISQINEKLPLTITDPNMTRFMMSLDQAVDLVLFAFLNGNNGDIFVQKSPAATIQILVEALKDLLNAPQHEVKIIGTRHGEKVYETLLTREERARSEDLGDYFRVAADSRDLNYNAYLEKGEQKITETDEYNSHNTHQLSKEELKELLLNLREISGVFN
ncbi:polysaccharide biosynthesis protein [Halobacteriovorax sp. RZ-1]|uniref:polysaccharide biosynthesis protein n=1 Tax=unclassified Halobacteriovorax TaxID=2639665 RepID=UPI00371C0DB4